MGDIRFTEETRRMIITYTTFYVAGMILIWPLLYAIARSGLYKKRTDVASIAVLGGTAVWATGFSTMHIYTLVLGGFIGPAGQAICQMQGAWLNSCAGTVLSGYFMLGKTVSGIYL